MKKVSRFSFILVFAMVLVLGPALVASAQDGTNPLCGGLAEADCQQLTTALDTMEGVGSFSISNWTLTLNIDTGEAPMSVTASGSAEFMMPADAEANPEQVFAHLTIDSYAISGTGDSDESGSAEVILQDGMSYVNYKGEWYGGEMSESDEADLATGIADLSSGNLDLGSLGMDLTGIMTTTSEASTDPAGTHFTATLAIDKLLAAFLGSEMGMEMVGGMMGMDTSSTDPAATQPAMSPEDMQMFAMIIAPMLEGTTLSFGLWTGDDNYIHRSALDATINVNLSAFDPAAAPITGEVHFQADLGGYNETFTAEAPTEYKPMEELDADVPDVESVLGG